MLKLITGLLALGGTMISSLSFAAAATAVDVADVTTGIGAQVASVTGVGEAALGVVVVVAAIAWVRRVTH